MRIAVLHDPAFPDELPALPASDGVRVVAWIALVDGFAQRLAQVPVDAVLMDLRGHADLTATLIAAVRHALPAVPLLVVGALGALDAARAALAGGVAGYVTRDPDRSHLLMALATIAKGGVFISRTSRRAMPRVVPPEPAG